ncbi:MAG: hypothetical protein AB198_01380 [Parcubacteria bacterium C7867-003]|nr:MAG: hypothetical protein AB198_01380 [Parcubacteria bacterium C7867-003]
MSVLKRFFNNFLPEELVSIGMLLFATYLNVFIYNNEVSFNQAIKSMVGYFTFGDKFYYIFFITVYFFALFDFYPSFSRLLVDWFTGNVVMTKQILIDLDKKLATPIRRVLPIAIVSGTMYQLLDNISYQFRNFSKDVFLAQVDLAVFGRLLFLDLPTYFNSNFISHFFAYFYISLSYVLPLFLVLLFILKKNESLRLAVTAFMLSFLFAYPFFYILPAQGPSYSIISNVRSVQLPEDLTFRLQSYKPNEYTARTMDNILINITNKEKDNSFPVSSIPSMHATWGMIVVFFLFKLRKYTLALSLPWIILMLLGGLYLGQHYLIDYFASVPVAGMSIFSAYWLLRLKKEKPAILLKSV